MSHMSHHQQHQAQRQQELLWEQQRLAQWEQAAAAEYQRLAALPLPDLAAEVMQRGFGPGGPGYDDDMITVAHSSSHRGPTVLEISHRFVPELDVTVHGVIQDAPGEAQFREQVLRLVAEGLQQLEHASMVRCQIHHDMGTFDWAATRWGRAALDRGEVASILRGSR